MTRLLCRPVLIAAAFVGSVGIASAQAASTPVTLKAPDGTVLKATYHAAAKPGPGILLLHQCNRDRKTWTHLATDAASRGFHVLALDYRGFGESEGQRFETFQEHQPTINEKWPGDVDAAFSWLTSQKGVDRERIGVAGASCGVNQSVLLARRHPEVKTVVLVSGGVNPEGRAYLQKSPWLPVFAAASRGDGDAVNTMRWILGWSRNASNKFVEYNAAGHGTDMFAVEKGLEPAILTWFETHLRNAPLKPAQTTTAAAPSPIEEFWTTLTQPDGVARARKMYDDARRRDPKVVLFPESEANAYGYQLLQAGNAKDAIVVFQMNVGAYPQSANTYDSLSDAYLAAGNREEVLRNAEKALATLPKDASATEELRAAILESAEKKIRELKKPS